MGRLSIYLHQTAVLEKALYAPSGQPMLDVYGQPAYGSPITVKCRKEPYTVRASSGYGQFVNYTTTYYLDSSVEVKNGDKLDGQSIQSVEEYIDGFGTLVGYRVDV